jgi:hypothetical protein
VAVLDTAPDSSDLAWARQHFPDNRHLQEVLGRLLPPIGQLEDPAFEAARRLALQTLEQEGGFHPVELAEPYDLRDHGLFVASVAHAAAPWVPLRLVRVLNNFGAGSLHSLVLGLIGLVRSKDPRTRLVVNLSLGILPALEQLATIWFGFGIRGLPGCPEDEALQFSTERPDLTSAELRERVERNDKDIVGSLNRLHRPLSHLVEVLQAHNCMVVAAGGNDSVFRGVDRRPRWNPRLPAAYDTVLGVAADTIHRMEPARYSNRGELPAAPVRDALATLGGDLAADGVSPRSGVIGVYTAEQFPPPSGALNESGWAEWSGTSFATPIMAGVSANMWASQANLTPAQLLAQMNGAARSAGSSEVLALGVPGVPVRLTWLP